MKRSAFNLLLNRATIAGILIVSCGCFTAACQSIQPEALTLLRLANKARAAAGVAPLQWDPSLALAARRHCLRMAAEGPIAHRYGGEADLGQRAAQAGARFSIVEENVAIGPDPPAIHEEWMHSPGHRANLLNPEVDRVGMAVVVARGTYYAAADYTKAVPALTPLQVEATIGNLLRAQGLTVLRDPALARAYCAREDGSRAAMGDNPPGFMMLWQDADLTHLPDQLPQRLGRYSKAAVGSCPAKNVEGAFTVYRIAVLLY